MLPSEAWRAVSYLNCPILAEGISLEDSILLSILL
jgi:hypothetical protein